MTHEPFIPWYWKSLDFAQLARDFPPPTNYFGLRPADPASMAWRVFVSGLARRQILVPDVAVADTPVFLIAWRQYKATIEGIPTDAKAMP